MAETDNPDAPVMMSAPARFSEGAEEKEKVARRERGHDGQHGHGGQQSKLGAIVQFLHDVRAEMRRVSWPTLNHVKSQTIITVIAVIFFAVYLFVVDQALSRLIVGLDWLIEKIFKFLGIA
jgi:preprotein translocase subunit SecE